MKHGAPRRAAQHDQVALLSVFALLRQLFSGAHALDSFLGMGSALYSFACTLPLFDKPTC